MSGTVSTNARRRPYEIYVDGRWTAVRSGATYPIPNPATEEAIAEAPDASREDMQAAIAAARRAFDDGPWRKTTPSDRRKILLAIADGLERRKEEMMELVVSASGAGPMMRWIQIEKPIENLRAYADLVMGFGFETMLPPARIPTPHGVRMATSMVLRQPVGVCGMIPTWNAPFLVSVQKLGPAIAVGNTIVSKPSPYVPLADLLLAEVIEDCDLPPGVFNVVTGQGPELGEELVASRAVDMISFTGSAGVGKAIMAAAAGNLKRLHLELGGKSALLVLDDADLDQVAPGAAAGVFVLAGQGCSRTTRVLVPERKQRDLLDRMAAFTETAVKIGDPRDPSVLLGPVIREERRRKIEEYIESGTREGARLVCGGRRPPGLSRGYFLEGTIFGDVRNDMTIAREEIFGPVVSVIPYRDEEEAIRIANDSAYGLAGGIATKDVARAIDLGRGIRTGNVGINGAFNPDGPIGGFKESGIGRESGVFGLEEFSEIQCITW